MDALHIEEKNGSRTPRGIPARCMPAVTTAIRRCCSAPRRYLAETRNFAGTVHFIFQPAEENEGGARVMVEEGLFDRYPVKRSMACTTGRGCRPGSSRCGPAR